MLLDQLNPRTAARTQVWRDRETGLPILKRVQDPCSILDANARDAAAFDPSRVARNPAGIRHVARLPVVVWDQLRQRGIVEGNRVVDPGAFLKFLSDPEHRRLRCDNGKRLA